MQIGEIRTLAGPNIYSHDPVLVMRLGLGDLYEKESCEIAGFVDRLLATLPGIVEHHCGLGRRGGFVERLREGTYFGHVVEHVALELTDALDISVNRGKTVEDKQSGWYLVAVAYRSERGMRELLRIAVELVEALIEERPYPLEDQLAEARRLMEKYELGPSTKAIVDAAVRRNIPWTRVDENSLVRLGYGIHSRYIEATISHNTRLIGVDIAGDKELTKQLLSQSALPVPRGRVAGSHQEAVQAFEELTKPVVAKPLDGNQGKGVSLNLTAPEQLTEAFDLAQQFSKRVIVEEMFRGRDYRVVLVGGRIVAAAERIPPHVWGDGSHTIAELIDETNKDPLRGNDHEKPLTKIKTDPVVLAILKKAGRSLDQVPATGELVPLRESANLSTGGSAKDVTDVVHPSIRRFCERAARVIGLDVCGVDMVLPEISEAYSGAGGIVEVNAAPGIRMHQHPSSGQARDVGAAIVENLYPANAPSRIPIVSITGTNGKTTVTRLIGHVIGSAGRNVGMTTTDGIWIAGEEVARGDMTGPWSARVVLSDPAVELAVLETARGGIVRSGLGYDWSDISVITNIQADHIGQDGIETIDDIVKIKALVAERVSQEGTLILNADDERCLGIPDRPKVQRVPKKIVWFTQDVMNNVVQDHLWDGGTAYVVSGGWIEERQGSSALRIVRVSSVPLTIGGSAKFQISNILAAVAACRAYGMEALEISAALQSFNSDQNLGRANLYELRGAYVLLDYGHNPAAIAAVGRMAQEWGTGEKICVLGLPGDRTDELLADSAREAARVFGHVILREDDDLRGREPGQLATILHEIIELEHPDVRCSIIPDETEALASAVQEIRPGDIVVAFCERLERSREFLQSHGAKPVSAVVVTPELEPAPIAAA